MHVELTQHISSGCIGNCINPSHASSTCYSTRRQRGQRAKTVQHKETSHSCHRLRPGGEDVNLTKSACCRATFILRVESVFSDKDVSERKKKRVKFASRLLITFVRVKVAIKTAGGWTILFTQHCGIFQVSSVLVLYENFM